MRITLLGYMGVGKTTIGQELSRISNIPFFDLDYLIQQKHHASVSDIFKEKGELFFRKEEHQLLKDFYAKNKDFILSVGGGTPVFYDNIDIMNKNSEAIYLSASVKTLSERLETEKHSRPLLAHLNNEQLQEFIAKHLFERNPFYTRAKYKVGIDNQSIPQITTQILSQIK